MAELDNTGGSPFSEQVPGKASGFAPVPPPPFAAGASPIAAGSSPFSASASFAAPPPPPPVLGPMMYELRPLSMGEILDRTFALYRGRFALYVGLAAVAAAVTTLGEFVRLTWGVQTLTLAPNARPAEMMGPVLISGLTSMVTSLLYLVAYSVTQAATVSAMSAAYLGEETSIGAALRVARRHWFRYILIVLWQAGSFMWLPVVLFVAAAGLLGVSAAVGGGVALRGLGIFVFVLAGLSMIWGFIAYLRNSLGIAASVSEGLPVPAAMKRSKALVAGRKWRPFVLFLLLLVLGLAAGVVQGVPAYFVLMTHGPMRAVLEGLTLLLTFVAGAVVAPVGAIALCLLYLDERVRREGFDVERLMLRAGSVAPGVVGGMSGSPFGGPGLGGV